MPCLRFASRFSSSPACEPLPAHVSNHLDALLDVQVRIGLASIAGAAASPEDVEDGHCGGGGEQEPARTFRISAEIMTAYPHVRAET